MKKLLFLFLILLTADFAWAESPFDGTWKIEIPRKFQLGERAVLVLQNGTFQCINCDPEINIKADGTDQAVSPKNKEYDTMSIKALDEKAVESTEKKDGKLVGMQKNTISADGKTSTIEITNYLGPDKLTIVQELTYSRIAEGPPGSHEISGTWQIENDKIILMNTFKSMPDGLIFSSSSGASWDAKFDGEDYIVKGGTGTTVSLNKVNERMIDETIKHNGKITAVVNMTVSDDGNTMTIVTEGKEKGTTTTMTGTKQ
jgi:hypothetical protein